MAKSRAKALPRMVFYKIHEAAATKAEALEKTGMAEASYDQRCSLLRSLGYPLKKWGGSGRIAEAVDANFEEIAAIKGCTVEEVKAEAEKLKAEAAARKAEREAAKAAEAQTEQTAG